MPFQTAFANRSLIKPTGASGYTEISIYGHEHGENDEGHEITSSTHNGTQSFIASILRGQATIRGHIRDVDLALAAAYPWTGSTIVIQAQGTGLLKLEYGGRQAFILPYFISAVQYTNETAGGTDFSATFKLSLEGSAISSGAYVTQYTRPS